MPRTSPRLRLVTIPAGGAADVGWRDETVGLPPGIDGVLAALNRLEDEARVVLGGGDVLARTDAPDLLTAVPESLEIETSGPLLASPRVLEQLQKRPPAALRVTLFSADLGCHDWIAGRPGEARRILRGVRAAAGAGLQVHVEVPLTRPGLGGLRATVEAAAALGARSVGFRALRLEHVPLERAVALGARVGLLEGPVAEASAAALQRGLRLELRGLPACQLPRGLGGQVAAEEGHPRGGCACGGDCVGLTAAYVELFGDLELRTSPTGDAPRTELSWTADEDRREVRRRLVRALEHRPEVLDIRGDDLLAHPAAADLLREAVRAARAVRVTGDLSPVLSWSPDELHRVRKLAGAASTGGGDSERGLARLAAAGVPT